MHCVSEHMFDYPLLFERDFFERAVKTRGESFREFSARVDRFRSNFRAMRSKVLIWCHLLLGSKNARRLLLNVNCKRLIKICLLRAAIRMRRTGDAEKVRATSIPRRTRMYIFRRSDHVHGCTGGRFV